MKEERLEPRVRRHIRITGRVQGVWYRGSTRDEARRLHLDGWVKNDPDGSVEAVAEGPPHAIDELLRWCEQGPPLARVERVTAVEEPPEDLRGFDIR